jgi:hypothetical protein
MCVFTDDDVRLQVEKSSVFGHLKKNLKATDAFGALKLPLASELIRSFDRDNRLPACVAAFTFSK